MQRDEINRLIWFGSIRCGGQGVGQERLRKILRTGGDGAATHIASYKAAFLLMALFAQSWPSFWPRPQRCLERSSSYKMAFLLMLHRASLRFDLGLAMPWTVIQCSFLLWGWGQALENKNCFAESKTDALELEVRKLETIVVDFFQHEV